MTALPEQLFLTGAAASLRKTERTFYMGNILCSDGFMKFFSAVKGNVPDIDHMMNMISSAIEPAAKEIFLGKLEISISSPSSIFSPAEIFDTRRIYLSGKGFEDCPQTESCRMGEDSMLTLKAYPEKGRQWDASQREAVSFLSEIIFLLSGRSRLMGMAEKAAMIDSLTGISNSRGLMRFGAELEKEKKLCKYAAAYMNIKNFKYINKTVGERQGDVILKKYAAALSGFIDRDELVARLGGDNFMVIVRKDRIRKFIEFVERIPVDAYTKGESRNYELEARIGVLENIRENYTVGDIMNCTSVAYNQTRVPGSRNCIYFSDDMLEKSLREKSVSLYFSQALKNHEFVVYYQPKVSLKDNSLCGCEALVRWLRTGKVVPPMEFIPVLEREGSVCRLDFYMLDCVCRDIRDWLDRGITPVRTSVNFSKAHLHNEKLASDILAVLDKYGVDSKYIEVEITESSGYENYPALSDFVKKMNSSGVMTSIDDFGTGYSSINLLKDLNVNVIKLDKSFLDEKSVESRANTVLIKNIVNMVNELDMLPITEGVETVQQAKFLKRIDCKMAQGYLFDRPLPHDEFEKKLVSGRVYNNVEL